MSSVVGQYTRRSNKAFGLAYTFFSNQKSLKGMWTDCIGKNSFKKKRVYLCNFCEIFEQIFTRYLRIPFWNIYFIYIHLMHLQTCQDN